MAEAATAHGGSRLWRRLYRVVRATTGRRLTSRNRFLDSAAFGGDFEARSDAARRIVPAAFEIIEHAPGRTLISVLALDHHSVDRLSPYRALAITLPVRYRDAAHGSFAISMPVTTEEARWTNAELYGLPSFVASVRAEREHETWVASLSVEGAHVLTLRVAEHPVSPAHERIELLGVRDDRRIIGSRFTLRGEAARSDLPGGATLELGDHPLADPLRRLEVSTESCSHLLYPHVLGELSKARVFGRVPREKGSATRAPRPVPA
jgi:hypothetical protein